MRGAAVRPRRAARLSSRRSRPDRATGRKARREPWRQAVLGSANEKSVQSGRVMYLDGGRCDESSMTRYGNNAKPRCPR